MGSCVIVCIVNKHQTAVGIFTINYPILIAIFFNNTVKISVFSDKLAIFAKQIPENSFILVITILGNGTSTGEHIVIFTEIILNAVKCYPAALNKCGAYAVSGACAVGSPSSHGCSVFSKLIGNTVDCLRGIDIQLIIAACITVHGVRCAAVDVFIAFVRTHILPALYKLVVDRVVEISVHFNDTGTGFENRTATFGLTYKLCVNYCVVMSLCFDHSTEVNYRLTSLTVGSVFITCSGAGSLLIENSQFCIVNVIGGRNGCKLGCYVNSAAEGVAVNNTVNNFSFNVYNRLVAHVCGSIRSVGYIVVTVEGPNSYGNAYERVVESKCVERACLFNGHGKNFGNFIVRKGSLEAICYNCALDFPSVCVVELDLRYELVYACEISNADVNVIDGLCFGSFAGVIMTAEFNHCIARNGEGTGDLHGVAKFVLDFERDGVNTCAQSNVALGGEHIAVDGGFNNYAVNGDLTGGKVESGIVGNGCGERNLVAVDRSAVFKRKRGIGSRISSSGNRGKYSVIHSRAVVESNIVDVERKLSGNSRLYVSTKERRRTRVTFVGYNGRAEIVILGNIDGHIYPT